MVNTDACDISWQMIQEDSRLLALKLAKYRYKGIIAIARGGLIPAGLLACELDIHLVDTLCLSSYDKDQQGQISVLKSLNHDGEGYLVIDDLSDTGNTFVVARKILPKAHFACLYVKPQGQDKVDVFIRSFEQSMWLNFPWDGVQDYIPTAENR